jgi:hypothetical protein
MISMIIYFVVVVALALWYRRSLNKVADASYKAGWFEGRGKLLVMMQQLEQEPVYADEAMVGRFTTELGLAASYSDAARDPEFAAILEREANGGDD